MRRFLLHLVAAFVTLAVTSTTTLAITPFKKPFDEKYVKDSDNADFRRAFRRAGCNVCHVKGKKRDYVNAYGLELSKLIPGSAQDRLDAAKEQGKEAKDAEQEKLLKEFTEAMSKVEAMKTSSGKTYGELFKAHELPPAEGAVSLRGNSEAAAE